MGVTIDSLQIEIQSSSANAAKGIDDLAKALEGLKKNGSFKTVSNNLNNLSAALKNLPNVYQASNALRNLAGSIEKLKSVGTVASLSNSLAKLPVALKSLEKINLNSVTTQMNGLVGALEPLSHFKASGFSSAVNAIAKIGKVTDGLDDAKIAKFADQIKKLDAAVSPFSKKMETIATAFRGLNVAIKETNKSLDKTDDSVNHSVFNFANLTTSIAHVAQALQGVIKGFAEVVDGASQWDGIAARFGKGFGAQAQETYEWIQRLNEEMAINTQQFMQYSSTYATMLVGFGVAQEDASKMALGYMELTYDIWAAHNDMYKTLDDAAEAVRSAIAGEVEPVRRAGFTIIESTLQETAANHGLAISLETATEAQKSYLRYLTMVDQAHATQLVGTYAKEMNTAEGVMRTFNQQLKSLGQAFGSLFLPILVKVMPYLQAFVDLLAEGVRWIAGLFGVEIQEIDFSGYGDGADAIQNVGNSANNATGALKDATEAAKELKNASIGIDELNVISPNSSTSGSSGSGGSGSGGSSGDAWGDIDSLWDQSIFDTIKSKVEGIKDRMKEWLGITGEINSWADFFDTRLGDILKLVGLIGGGIAAWKVTKSFMDAIDSLKLLLANPKYAITISAILTIVGITMAISGMDDAIENGLDGFNFGEIVGGSLLTATGSAILGSKLATWITTTFAGSKVATALTTAATNLGVGTAGAAGAALSAGVAGIVLGIPTMFVGIYDALNEGLNWLNGILIPAGATAAGAGIGAIIGALGGPIGVAAGALIGVIVGLLVDLGILIAQEWDKISAWFVDAGNAIGDFFSDIGKAIGDFFTKTIPDWWNGFVSWIGSAWSSITSWFDSLPEKAREWGYAIGYAIGSAIKSALEFFTETVPNFFADVWATLKNFVTVKIPNFFKDLWNTVTTALGTFFTQIIPDFFEKVGNAFNTFFTETIPNAFMTVVDFVKGIPQKIWEAIQEAWSWLVGIGKSIVDGIVEGLSNIGDAIGNFVDGFIQGVKDALGIHSPSTEFEEIAGYCIDGLKRGLGVDAITERFSTMWTSAKGWWDTKKTALKEYTPSIGSVSEKVKTRWDSAKSWWDKSKSGMKEYTPNIGSIYEKLKERWDNARTWWNDKKTKAKEYTPSIGSIYEKVYDRWKNARDWWNNKKAAMKSYTPSIGSITDKIKSAWNSAKSWWSKNAKLSTKLDVQVPKITVKWDTATAFGKSFKYPTGFSLKFAANGGIFDQGSLIWAGERGPEIMANAGGGRTGVMNVQQMQDAVYEGVYAAVSAAMRNNSGRGSQEVNVYLDGRQITAAVEQRQRERGATIMGNEVYSY